jgi:hypothetical protein
MRTLVFTQSNIINDGQNNKLRYNFPNSVLFKKNSIAVASVNMYYSWFNISAAYQNNTLIYNWRDNTGSATPYTITIPDGVYEITDLNNLLQFTFIANGHYLINATGQNVYFAEFVINPTRYAVQINTFLIPTSLPAGYTQPANFAGYSNNTYNTRLTIPANINIIMGYPAGFLTNTNIGNIYVPPTGQDLISKNSLGTISYLSTQPPNLQPNSSIYVSISNVNNPYSVPSSIIYSITAQGAVGTLITEKTPQYAWNKMIDGTYNNLTITLLGSDFAPIKINDPQMTIMLVIKEDGELD